jgi:hypothetical protein
MRTVESAFVATTAPTTGALWRALGWNRAAYAKAAREVATARSSMIRTKGQAVASEENKRSSFGPLTAWRLKLGLLVVHLLCQLREHHFAGAVFLETLHAELGVTGITPNPTSLVIGSHVGRAAGSAQIVGLESQLASDEELQISQHTVWTLHRSILCRLKPPCMNRPFQTAARISAKNKTTSHSVQSRNAGSPRHEPNRFENLSGNGWNETRWVRQQAVGASLLPAER